jgi:hypothetical protein
MSFYYNLFANCSNFLYLAASILFGRKQMLKKLNCAILCATALFTGQALAAKHTYKLGVNTLYAIPLEPNEPTIFENTFFLNLNVVCSTHIDSTAEEANSELYGVVLKKKVKVNGKELTVGQDISFILKKEDSFKLWAQSGAQVEITNRSEHTILANCGLA